MTRRRAAFVTLLALFLLGLSLLAISRRSRPSPVMRVRAAPILTRSARSAHLVLEVGLRPNPGARSATVAGDGLLDFARRRSALTLDLDSLGLGRVEERVIGPRVYLRWAGVSSASTPWMTTDLSGLGSLANFDPAAAIDYLRGATAARLVGREVVAGALTSRYTASVRLGAAIAQQLGADDLVVDVWLDRSGRVTRLAYDVDLGRLPRPAGAPAVAGQMRTTMAFERYGVTVAVDPPPAEQVSSG